jgi:hypothetical protein
MMPLLFLIKSTRFCYNLFSNQHMKAGSDLNYNAGNDQISAVDCDFAQVRAEQTRNLIGKTIIT